MQLSCPGERPTIEPIVNLQILFCFNFSGDEKLFRLIQLVEVVIAPLLQEIDVFLSG
jgi:hypothetical protein